MAFVNPLQAVGPISRAAWSTLMGTNIPKWVYPAFGAAAAAPIVGSELDRAREARERRAAAAAVKAAMAVAAELPPGSEGNLQRLDRLGAALRSAKARRYATVGNKPKTTFRQDADTVSTGSTEEPQQLPSQQFATA